MGHSKGPAFKGAAETERGRGAGQGSGAGSGAGSGEVMRHACSTHNSPAPPVTPTCSASNSDRGLTPGSSEGLPPTLERGIP